MTLDSTENYLLLADNKQSGTDDKASRWGFLRISLCSRLYAVKQIYNCTPTASIPESSSTSNGPVSQHINDGAGIPEAVIIAVPIVVGTDKAGNVDEI